MEKDSHFIPDEIRSYIVGQVESGFTYDQTIENVEQKYSRIVTKGAISKIMDNFHTAGSVSDLLREGAPHIYSTKQEQMIIDTVKRIGSLQVLTLHETRNLISMKQLREPFRTSSTEMG